MDTPSISAATVVVNDVGDVLLIQRADNGQWNIPGGVIEKGETPVAAAVRETKEETGIDVSVNVLTGVYTNVALGVVAMVFRAEPLDGSQEVALSDESVAVEWVTPTRALEILPESFVMRVSDALAAGSAVRFRSHEGGAVTDTEI